MGGGGENRGARPRAALPAFRARDFFAEAQAAEESLLLPVAADSCAPIKQATGFPSLLTGLLKTSAAASNEPEPQVGASPASGGIMAQIERRLADRPPPQVGDDDENGLGSLIDSMIDEEESRLCAPRQGAPRHRCCRRRVAGMHPSAARDAAA